MRLFHISFVVARRFTAPLALSLSLIACGNAATADTMLALQAPTVPPTPSAAAGIPLDPHITVDQFGYRPTDRKVSVIRDPRTGYDSQEHFTPGGKYQVRNAADGRVAWAGAPASWRGGRVDAGSGDAGWWFDFSALQTAGTYFLYDEVRAVRSATFRIDPLVYAPVLKAAVRTFFYQRSGFAKLAPWADECWADEASFLGPGQDLEARDVGDPENSDKARDLSGGWFDAGDPNKYVTFASAPVHQLLGAYEGNPGAFTDDFNIPESGNAIPDLLDEVKWEIDWLKRMQNDDGSVALKVGSLEYSPAVKPSLDPSARYYIARCSSSTIAAAGMFAHAALAFRPFDQFKDEQADLLARAIRAWKQFHASPRQTACDDGKVKAGDADWSEEDQNSEAVVAAVYLFALTGEREYDDYVRAHYRETKPYRDMGWSRYNAHQGEALLFHARQPGVDGKLAAAIIADKSADAAAGNQIYGMKPEDDLYRAYLHDSQYHWGSHQVRANYANTNLDAARLFTGERSRAFADHAQDILHYFHGVNPFSMVYLSNMYPLGATRSVNEIYHTWFAHDSIWDSATESQCGPAPGFLPGGPNANAASDGVPAALTPPAGQPRQKSYRDWNTSWPDSSWAVTEPAIYYQAAYIKMLSAFAGP